MRTQKSGSSEPKSATTAQQPPLFSPNGSDAGDGSTIRPSDLPKTPFEEAVGDFDRAGDQPTASPSNSGGLKPPFDNLESLQLPEEPERPPSVFHNLEALKIGLDDDDDVSEDVLTMVPIRRPGKKFFQTHRSPEYQFVANILEDQDSKTTWYVTPLVARQVGADNDIKRVVLALCINRVGVMFFWPIPSTGTFHASGVKAVALARKHWIKAIGDLSLGGYRTRISKTGDFGPPAWPETMPSLNELLELAFHGNIIDSLDHPALREQ